MPSPHGPPPSAARVTICQRHERLGGRPNPDPATLCCPAPRKPPLSRPGPGPGFPLGLSALPSGPQEGAKGSRPSKQTDRQTETRERVGHTPFLGQFAPLSAPPALGVPPCHSKPRLIGLLATGAARRDKSAGENPSALWRRLQRDSGLELRATFERAWGRRPGSRMGQVKSHLFPSNPSPSFRQ